MISLMNPTLNMNTHRLRQKPTSSQLGQLFLILGLAMMGGGTASAAPVSIWPGNPTPTITSVTNDFTEVELGLKFQSSVNGYITGVRFYKGTNNLGTHVGSLWTTGGQLLGSTVFVNETATGWQQQSFSSAIAIASNTTYVISYRAPQGGYAIDGGYFATSGVTNTPLRALSNTEASGNGVYRYGEGAFPSLNFNAANYWVDVVFDTVIPVDTNKPVVTTVSPSAGQTNVATSVTLSITFSEPMLASSITTTNIFLQDATNGIVPTSVSLSGNPLVATLTPLAPLPPNTNFTATIKGGVNGVADLATNRMATDFSWSFTTAPSDIVAPTVSSFSPGAAITKVSIATGVSVTFSEPMRATSISTTNFVLRDAANALVPASISYDTVNRRATLTPSNYLASASNYTAYVYGGATGVKDLAGNPMSGTNSWSFTTVPAHPYGQGTGGSVLLLTQDTNRISYYLGEILLTEGLNQFAIRDISTLSSNLLTNFTVVVIGNISLTSPQVTTLSNWVVNGGSLIATRPSTNLARLLGLTSLGSTLAEGYIGVNTSVAPGQGIVGTTMQYHGIADRYALNGATSVATLYSNATTATTNPAVTWRSVGSNGGRAACFTYDLARSVSLTRQGNPAWANQERDGFSPLRSSDLFYGPSTSDPQPNWVDLSRVAIPQADEQQRLLVNLIHFLGTPKKPLPRFWYFPDGHKAVIVMTGDDHANGATAGRFNQYIAYSPANAVVTNWQALRSSSYIYPNTALSSAAAFSYHTNGFEIGLHVSSFCDNYTREQMESYWSTQLVQFAGSFPTLPLPTTYRTHCIAWSGYTLTPEIASHFGLRFDVNYYYWPPGWVQNTPGVFTGSAMPMRFAALDGSVIDVFQAATQMTDESGQTYPFTSATLLDRALDTNGFYGAYVANMHTDFNPLPDSDNLVASAQSRGVPIVSAKQMLTWLDGRNASYFTNVVWTNKALSFAVSAPGTARGLKSLVPIPSGHLLVNVRSNGVAITAATELVKGVSYVTFPVASANYLVTFDIDTTPPTVTSITPTNGATSVPVTTPVAVVFNEAMLASTINTNTILLLNNAAAVVPAQVSYNPSTFTATLTPNAQLALSQTYTSVVVSGVSGVKDLATNALVADATASFTTTDVQTFSIWNGSTTPANITATETNANELGMKFRALTNGYITGIRFYKGPANTGTHIGNLWSSGGAQLNTVTFTNESTNGWQHQNFAAPVAIVSNTTYIISYHSPVGGYSFDSGYFSGGSITNSPLIALGNGLDGANAVFKPGATGFPNQSAAGLNFWVDPVFATSLGPDTNAPLVQSVTPLNGATNVGINTGITVTFSEAMDPASLETSTFLLVGSGITNSAFVSYNPATFTASLQPSNALALNQTYTVTVKGGINGVKDLSTNALASDYQWSFTTTPEQLYNLWGNTNPAVASFSDPNPYELGMKFRSLANGFIKGVRFYKGASNTGTHTGNLWLLGNTTALATVTFSNETATGWQEQNFTTPVAINSNTTYIISYHTTAGNYAVNVGGFNGGSVTNSPLIALGNGVDGNNGVINAGSSSAYPGTGSVGGNNYWVDAIYISSVGPDTNAPLVESVSPLAGATNVSVASAVNVTFNEGMLSSSITANTLRLVDAATNYLPAALSYNSGTRTATLQPSNTLALGQTYTATVFGGSNGVKDLATNALASNFVWSFTTQPPDLTPPTIVTVNPTNGAANVALNPVISLVFSEAMTAVTITTNTVRLLDPSSNAIPASLTYSDSTFTVTLQPSNSLAPGQTCTIRVTGGGSGVKDLASNALGADFTAQFTTTSNIDYSIWPPSTVPANITFDPGDTNNPYEFGVKFLSQAAGYIKGVRFYKGPANNGTHYGSLWATNGTRLAFATFSNETATGWQQVNFSSAIQVASNTTYVASYFSPAGGYSLDRTNEAGGLLVGVTNLPLIALANSVTPNGVFVGSAGTGTNASIFPTNSGNGVNYWVDVVFQPLTNAAPIVANPIPDQSGVYGTDFTYAFPTNTFSDPEGGTLTYSAFGMPTGVTFASGTRTFAGAPAQSGNYPISVVAADNGSPASSTTNVFTLSVALRTLIVTALNTNKTYGVELLPTLYSVVGLTNNDSVTNVTLTSTGSPTNATIGSYPILPGSPLGAGLTNYSITLSNGTMTVDAATLTITALDTNKVYGSALEPTLHTVSGLLNNDSVTNVTLTSSGSSTNATVGTYAIAPSNALGLGLTNYSLAYSNGLLTVDAKGLLIVAADTNKTYGVELLPTLYSVVGLTNNDSVTNVTLTSTGSPTNATIGSYPILPGSALGAGLTNYSITLSNGTMTVDAATLTITALDTNKAVGVTLVFAGTEFTTIGLTNSDSVTTATLASAGSGAGAAAGTYPITITNALGNGLTNYLISYVTGTLTATNAGVHFMITSVVFTNDVATVTWNSTSNVSYVLQYKDNLIDPTWIDSTFAVLATGESTSTTNTLDGAPQRFYRIRTATVVAPVPAPLIQSLIVDGTNAIVTWTSVSNATYQLQFRASLDQGNWTPVVPSVMATGASTSLTNDMGSDSQRFYRVQATW